MFKKVFFFFCVLSINVCSAYQYDLAICTIFRNDAPYLKEWIEFHKLVGVQHFYLYNHNSTDDYATVLQPYIDRGEVEFVQFDSSAIYLGREHLSILEKWNILQCYFYSKVLVDVRGVCKWVAFLDSDEFLYPIERVNLIDFLKDYEHCAGLGVNWHMFGTSDVEKIPDDKLMIETLVNCSPPDYWHNIHIKSIVRPELAQFFINPHFAIYYPGFTQVNTDCIPFEGPFSPYIQLNKLRINHYWVRDEYYFQNYKIPRKLTWGNQVAELVEIKNISNLEVDTTILRYLEPLKEAVFQNMH